MTRQTQFRDLTHMFIHIAGLRHWLICFMARISHSRLCDIHSNFYMLIILRVKNIPISWLLLTWCLLSDSTKSLAELMLFLINEVLWHSPESHFTVPKLIFSIMNFKIIHFKLQPHFPGANELSKPPFRASGCLKGSDLLYWSSPRSPRYRWHQYPCKLG